MKIHSSTEVATQVNRSKLAETKSPTGKISALQPGDEGTGEGAVVEFSQRSKDIQRVQQVLQSHPDIRSEKVKAIKERIKKGTYEIDVDATADKIVKSFFDDMP